MRSHLWLVALPLLCIACVSPTTQSQGGVNNGSATVTGSVAGQTLAPGSTLFYVNNVAASPNTNNQPATILTLVINSFPDLCIDSLGAQNQTTQQQLLMAAISIGTTHVQTGIFNLTSPSAPSGGISLYGESLFENLINGNPTQTVATGGSITVNTYSASAANGTFALVFGNTTMDGRFSAAPCPRLGL